jgi:hypothetical protein
VSPSKQESFSEAATTCLHGRAGVTPVCREPNEQSRSRGARSGCASIVCVGR